MYGTTILGASDGESAFLLTVTGVCQVRSTWSNHSPLVLVTKWANASFTLVWVQSKVKTWQKITITVATVKCQKPDQALGLRCPHCLLPKQYVGCLGFHFLICSLFWIHSYNAHMDKVMTWKGNSHWLKYLFSVENHYLLFSRQTYTYGKESCRGVWCICNQQIWKYFKVNSAYICLHITKYC